MKVIIAGPRGLYVENHHIWDAIKSSGFDVDEIVSGGATGIDSCAEVYATDFRIPCTTFAADWDEAERLTGNRKSADPIRNMRMAEYADALIVVKQPGPASSGTANMIRQAQKRGLPVHIEEVS